MSENLLDGSTECGPENAWPADPGEFAARWNALGDPERARWLASAVDAMSAMPELDRLRAEVERLTWERDHFERCFTEANASAAAALRGESVLRARLAAVEAGVAKARAEMVGMEASGAPLVSRKWVVHRLDAAMASAPAVDAGDPTTEATHAAEPRSGAPEGDGTSGESQALRSAHSDAGGAWCACGSPGTYALTPGERVVHGTEVCLICREASGDASEVQP